MAMTTHRSEGRGRSLPSTRGQPRSVRVGQGLWQRFDGHGGALFAGEGLPEVTTADDAASRSNGTTITTPVGPGESTRQGRHQPVCGQRVRTP